MYSGYMVGYTTIQIAPKTREMLSDLKTSRETYDELIRKLLSLIPEGDDEGKYNEEFRIGLLNARLDILRGNVISHEELKRKMGL